MIVLKNNIETRHVRLLEGIVMYLEGIHMYIKT
jgi:hypothetical protein